MTWGWVVCRKFLIVTFSCSYLCCRNCQWMLFSVLSIITISTLRPEQDSCCCAAIILNWISLKENIGISIKFIQVYSWGFNKHQVSTAAGNGLMLSGNKPLPEPMLTRKLMGNIVFFTLIISREQHTIYSRADSGLGPCQWETSLQSNAISHWLGANLDSALYSIKSIHTVLLCFVFL